MYEEMSDDYALEDENISAIDVNKKAEMDAARIEETSGGTSKQKGDVNETPLNWDKKPGVSSKKVDSNDPFSDDSKEESSTSISPAEKSSFADTHHVTDKEFSEVNELDGKDIQNYEKTETLAVYTTIPPLNVPKVNIPVKDDIEGEPGYKFDLDEWGRIVQELLPQISNLRTSMDGDNSDCYNKFLDLVDCHYNGVLSQFSNAHESVMKGYIQNMIITSWVDFHERPVISYTDWFNFISGYFSGMSHCIQQSINTTYKDSLAVIERTMSLNTVATSKMAEVISNAQVMNTAFQDSMNTFSKLTTKMMTMITDREEKIRSMSGLPAKQLIDMRSDEIIKLDDNDIDEFDVENPPPTPTVADVGKIKLDPKQSAECIVYIEDNSKFLGQIETVDVDNTGGYDKFYISDNVKPFISNHLFTAFRNKSCCYKSMNLSEVLTIDKKELGPIIIKCLENTCVKTAPNWAKHRNFKYLCDSHIKDRYSKSQESKKYSDYIEKLISKYQ